MNRWIKHQTLKGKNFVVVWFSLFFSSFQQLVSAVESQPNVTVADRPSLSTAAELRPVAAYQTQQSSCRFITDGTYNKNKLYVASDGVPPPLSPSLSLTCWKEAGELPAHSYAHTHTQMLLKLAHLQVYFRWKEMWLHLSYCNPCSSFTQPQQTVLWYIFIFIFTHLHIFHQHNTSQPVPASTDSYFSTCWLCNLHFFCSAGHSDTFFFPRKNANLLIIIMTATLPRSAPTPSLCYGAIQHLAAVSSSLEDTEGDKWTR